MGRAFEERSGCFFFILKESLFACRLSSLWRETCRLCHPGASLCSQRSGRFVTVIGGSFLFPPAVWGGNL